MKVIKTILNSLTFHMALFSLAAVAFGFIAFDVTGHWLFGYMIGVLTLLTGGALLGSRLNTQMVESHAEVISKIVNLSQEQSSFVVEVSQALRKLSGDYYAGVNSTGTDTDDMRDVSADSGPDKTH